jgi:uncharacterized RDD family membrane protein YckC
MYALFAEHPRGYIEQSNQDHSKRTATLLERYSADVLDFVLFSCTLGIGWILWMAVSSRRGSTPGKILLGITVVDRSIGKASVGQMWVREVALKWGPLAVLLSIGGSAIVVAAATYFVARFLWLRCTSDKQDLWDRIFDTFECVDS